MDKPKILIVDDLQENLFAMGELVQLHFQNVQILTANSGQRTLELTLEHDFALILLDIQMPEMDGFETATLLRGRKTTANIPIIFLTANYSSEEHIFKGYEAGAVDFLLKPVNKQILTSKIRIFLTIYEQRLLLESQTLDLAQKVDELERLHMQLEVSNQQLKEMSMQDGLTGIANRRFFDEMISQQWRRSQRLRLPISLILLDIDHFKAYNDNYGHIKGDECLKGVADVLSKELCRQSDMVARYGGEEFAIILPDTDFEGTLIAAERLRQSIEELKMPHCCEPDKFLTISLGCCTAVPDQNSDVKELIENADTALYRAKSNGRNRVEQNQIFSTIKN